MRITGKRGLAALLQGVASINLTSAFVAVGFLALGLTSAHAAFISLNGTNYFQDFDSLASRRMANDFSSTWRVKQFGDVDEIVADNGSSTAGGAYSYGAIDSSDRALGTLRNNGDSALFGASFQNTGDGPITRLNISYTGEEWRLGAEGRGADRLQFQYSLNARSLSSGTWINAPSLDFLTPNLTDVGAHDGNLPVNQTHVSGAISFLNIPAGETFWVRWVDAALPGGGPEDGLAIDDFSITAVPEAATWAAGLSMSLVLGVVLWKRGAFRATATSGGIFGSEFVEGCDDAKDL